MAPELYKHIARPILAAILPAETAQRLALYTLRAGPLWNAAAGQRRPDDPRLAVEWCGIRLRNPIGLAAGLDKDCRLLPSLARLGFGYLVAGTVTLLPRAGNRKPRVFLDRSGESLVNALGFPGRGLAAAARELARARGKTGDTPIVVSIAGTSAEDVSRCHRTLEPLVDAVEVNISSPNTAGLRIFHEASALSDLLGAVNEGRSKPLLVKLPPYPEADGGEEAVLSLARACRAAGVDGLTVANSRPVEDDRLAVGRGGLSGRPIYSRMLDLARDVRREVGPGIAVNACGGIFTGRHAREALDAGADTAQIYTGMVYRGPSAARRIKAEMLETAAARLPAHSGP